MKVISPSAVNGTITIIPSKSISHRALVCSALAKGTSTIQNIMFSEDIRATANALRDMGFCEYEYSAADSRCVVHGALGKVSRREIDCGESGSTLRFLIPLGLDGIERIFTGKGRLMRRPISGYDKLFARNRVKYWKSEEEITLCGLVEGGEYALRGDVSSQFITGLLFKFPLLFDDSGIHITTELESKPYVEMTRDVQALFGIHSYWDGNTIEVPGRQGYTAQEIEIEGDYSHAAFFAAAAAISGTVEIKGLRPASRQGDKEIMGILKCMGAQVVEDEKKTEVCKQMLKPIEVDVSQIPDLVPVLAVLGCAARGKTRIYNAARLRYKESDRLHAITVELEKLGAHITEYQDSLLISGTGSLEGGTVNSHNDHRIAMALAVASCIAKGDIVIEDAGCVAKSAPRFYEEFKSLGGKVR
ncbi:MAG: 3-phosphoshikimate 1-carboxyvinyltransferase [Christensenella sp.]|nr:3-phosphoshikimate 1-carboxyvinyltransferase [Christensenella sp.]